MFGLNNQVIAALLAAALFVILAAGLYIRHVFNDRAELQLRAARQASVIEGHERTERALRDEAAKKEAAYAENARAKAKLAADLRAARADFQSLVRASPTVRAWADTALPGEYADRLRARTGVPGAGGDPGDAPGGPAH